MSPAASPSGTPPKNPPPAMGRRLHHPPSSTHPHGLPLKRLRMGPSLVSVQLPPPAPMRQVADSLRFIAEYVSLAVEEDLTPVCKEICDPHPGTKRLFRQFAPKFNHKTPQPTPLLPVQVSAPFIFLRFIEDLEGLLEITVIQALLWVYPPASGIGQHVDQLALGEVVTTLSLAYDSLMDFGWGGGVTQPPTPSLFNSRGAPSRSWKGQHITVGCMEFEAKMCLPPGLASPYRECATTSPQTHQPPKRDLLLIVLPLPILLLPNHVLAIK